MASDRSVVNIVNQALILLGEEFISSLEDDTYAARLATQVYQQVVDSLTRSYRWNFAIGRAALAYDPDATPAFGFDYSFPVPDDFLSLITVYDADDPFYQTNYTSGRIQYKVESGCILADENPLNIIYVRRVENPNMYDPMFVDALVASLALRLCMPLTNSSSKLSVIQKTFDSAVRAAKSANAIETTAEVIVSTEWVDARGGETGGRTHWTARGY